MELFISLDILYRIGESERGQGREEGGDDIDTLDELTMAPDNQNT